MYKGAQRILETCAGLKAWESSYSQEFSERDFGHILAEVTMEKGSETLINKVLFAVRDINFKCREPCSRLGVIGKRY